MPDLESEESAAQSNNQAGQGLKILTPNEMICRLPITLPQLHARKNAQKLKNEIRQLLYPLYCSKKITKPVYNSPMKYSGTSLKWTSSKADTSLRRTKHFV